MYPQLTFQVEPEKIVYFKARVCTTSITKRNYVLFWNNGYFQAEFSNVSVFYWLDKQILFVSTHGLCFSGKNKL